MHFPVCIALLLVCSTLLEAVPSPQIKNAEKQRWRPKAIREKEAAEEAARAAEEAIRTSTTTEGTTEVVEDVTEIVQEAITMVMTKEMTGAGVEEDEQDISATIVSDDKTSSSIVIDKPMEIDAVVVTTQKNVVEISSSSEQTSTITSPNNKSENISTEIVRVSTDDGVKAEMSTSQKKAAAPVEVENFCRLSLRGKSCTCRFEKTCRCDCGRIFSATTNNPQSSAKKSANRNQGQPNRIRIQRFQFPKSNKH